MSVKTKILNNSVSRKVASSGGKAVSAAATTATAAVKGTVQVTKGTAGHIIQNFKQDPLGSVANLALLSLTADEISGLLYDLDEIGRTTSQDSVVAAVKVAKDVLRSKYDLSGEEDDMIFEMPEQTIHDIAARLDEAKLIKKRASSVVGGEHALKALVDYFELDPDLRDIL